MDSRLKDLLTAVVETHIRSGRPVGSKHLAASSPVALSSASIRNMMAKLEQAGFLYKPHTSAGRVPTDRGYRYYVDKLAAHRSLRARERRKIARAVVNSQPTRVLLRKIAQLLGSISGQVCIILPPYPIKEGRRIGLSLVSHPDEEGCWVFGRDKIVGELGTIEETRSLLRVLDDPERIRKAIFSDDSTEGIRIGRENPLRAMYGCSLIWSSYRAGKKRGVVAIVGPKRIEYGRMMALVRYASEYLTNYFEQEGGTWSGD